MTTLTSELTTAQSILYGRRRILDALYREDPELTHSVKADDIADVSLRGDKVRCTLSDGSPMLVDRSAVIENFWNFRTRTPSYFDYKIWSAYSGSFEFNGVPVGALDYSPAAVDSGLELELGRVPRLAVDKDGAQKIYFVVEEQNTCTCGSWNQMHLNRAELEEEFKSYSSLEFVPVCKHLQWFRANMKLQTQVFQAKQKTDLHNRNLCAYYFDHRHGMLRYRITYQGLSTDAKWLPAEGWKEKAVYNNAGNPTGACWEVFEKALTCEHPFKLVLYSQSLAALMSRTGSR